MYIIILPIPGDDATHLETYSISKSIVYCTLLKRLGVIVWLLHPRSPIEAKAKQLVNQKLSSKAYISKCYQAKLIKMIFYEI